MAHMTPLYTEQEILAVLRQRVAQYPSQEQAAKALGVSGVFLSGVLRGKQRPGTTIAAALGYRRCVVYERVQEEA